MNGGGSEAAQRRPLRPDPHLRRPRSARTGPWRRLLAGGIGLAITLIVLLGGGPPLGGTALAWTVPGRTAPSSAASRARRATVPASPRSATVLQEVAAPIAVQQLGEALAQRQPRLTILEPADGALIPEGPWALRLQVEDWPLVDAGPLGLGPHLLIQLDDGPALPVVQTSLEMPPLSPGSHRLTVMAARPWGEVVKRPGAFQQIRLQRIAANPLSQPASGSPQLLATAPLGASPAEPVLLDWLLIDAPLQNLRADDARWRLRVSVNGDSFLVDQATPLWLKGWRQGSNALVLELVDGRGEPLNPPFNTLVREVRLLADGPRPAWLNGRLSDTDLARLLGQAPPEPEEPEPLQMPLSPAGAATDTAATGGGATADPGTAAESEGMADRDGPKLETPETTMAAAETEADSQKAVDAGAEVTPTPVEPAGQPAPVEGPQGTSEPEQIPVETQKGLAAEPPGEQGQTRVDEGQAEREAEGEDERGQPEPAPVQAPPSAADPAATPAEPEQAIPAPAGEAAPAAAPAQAGMIASEAPPAASSSAPPAVTAARPRPSAREEVGPDGTLIRPARSGALQALRERLRR